MRIAIVRRIALYSFFSLIFFFSVFTAVHSQSPSPTSVPEFRLNAAAGKLTPKSSMYFLDGIIDNLKLALKFSSNSKVNMRMNITDEKIVEMKQALEDKNLVNVTKAAKAYKGQLKSIQQSLDDNKLNTAGKERLQERVSQQDEAFLHLKAIADEKTGPIVNDAWSQLQNLKQSSN